VIQLGDELAAQSQRTGLSTRALQEWRFIAERSNVEAEDLVGSMGKLQRAAFSAARGNREAGSLFAELGVNVRSANGQVRSANALMLDTATAMAAIEDPAERATRVQQLFGRQGSKLLPLFAEGQEGIALLVQRFEELGGGLSGDVVAGAEAADDAFTDFRLAMTTLKGTLSTTLLPAIARAVTTIADIVAKASEWIKTSSTLETVLFGLTAALAPFIVAAAGLLVPIAILGALFLIAEDVATAFRGGQSVFGEWVEWVLKAYGVSLTFTGVLETVGIAWENLKATVIDAIAGMVGGLAQLHRFLGIESDASEWEAGLRDQAAGARRTAANLTTAHETGETRRLRERSAVASAAITKTLHPTVIVERPSARRRAGVARRERVRQQTIAPVFHIHGADAGVVERTLERTLNRVLRETDDESPVGDEDDDA